MRRTKPSVPLPQSRHCLVVLAVHRQRHLEGWLGCVLRYRKRRLVAAMYRHAAHCSHCRRVLHSLLFLRLSVPLTPLRQGSHHHAVPPSRRAPPRRRGKREGSVIIPQRRKGMNVVCSGTTVYQRRPVSLLCVQVRYNASVRGETPPNTHTPHHPHCPAPPASPPSTAAYLYDYVYVFRDIW